jgi:hypothetical protein
MAHVIKGVDVIKTGMPFPLRMVLPVLALNPLMKRVHSYINVDLEIPSKNFHKNML